MLDLLITFVSQGWNHVVWSEPNMVLWALLAMFVLAFLAATLLPVASEAAFAMFIVKFPFAWVAMLAAAVFGNSLGAATTLYAGRGLAHRLPPGNTVRRFPLVERYGVWSLLLSCVPLIGDGLVLAAGWLLLPLGWSMLAIITGKLLRYLVIALLFLP